MLTARVKTLINSGVKICKIWQKIGIAPKFADPFCKLKQKCKAPALALGTLMLPYNEQRGFPLA